MLTYLDQTMLEPQIVTPENKRLLSEALWIDLLSPSKTEEEAVEQCIGRNLPTREEMIEIELSSRLYQENGTFFMTALMIAHSNSPTPTLEPVSFVLTPKQFITIRYFEPQSFQLYVSQIKKMDHPHRDATALLIELLDTTIDRLADILELISARLDDYSKTIFQQQHGHQVKIDYQQLMNTVGATADLNTKARESLVTFNRLISFFGQVAASRIDNKGQLRLASLSKDIASLSDHADFLSTKINFLLDATLGMVNIEQNNIIKLFSVAAVIFLPPTLVASIYGMNFHFMPELTWKHGYLFAIGMILFAAWLPYKYFKYRKWL